VQDANAKKMKIIRVITRLNIGGPALHAWSLSEGLTSAGIDTILVTGVCSKDESNYASDLIPKDFQLRQVQSLRRAVGVLGDFVTLWQLVKLFRRERPEIVHTHTAKAGLLGRIAAMLTGVPVIIHTYHGHVLAGYFSNRISAVIRMIERNLAKKTHAIITISPLLREEIVEKFHVTSRDKVRVIPLGRNLSSFLGTKRKSGTLRQELGISDPECLLIGMVGRLVPIKNISLALESLAMLPSELNWQSVIVGDGEERTLLQQLAQKFNLSHKVHFLGWRRDLENIYSEIDLLVNSSLNEGTPLSIIEAFAAGCPVVATNVGGVKDLFQENEKKSELQFVVEGALVKSGSASSMSTAIEKLLKDQELRAACSSAGRKSSEKFSDQLLLSRMADLYRELTV
jgi:glycosyltransferase involved in cell wall biosynthesis